MSTPMEPLQQLVEQWRESIAIKREFARLNCYAHPVVSAGMIADARILENCVDQLDALLVTLTKEQHGSPGIRRDVPRNAGDAGAANGGHSQADPSVTLAPQTVAGEDAGSLRVLAMAIESGIYPTDKITPGIRQVAREYLRLSAPGTLAPHQEWQPIATAPKDFMSRIILGFAPDEENYAPSSREGSWNATLHRWGSTLDPDWTGSPQPTHWMPLPPPPAEPPTDQGSNG